MNKKLLLTIFLIAISIFSLTIPRGPAENRTSRPSQSATSIIQTGATNTTGVTSPNSTATTSNSTITVDMIENLTITTGRTGTEIIQVTVPQSQLASIYRKGFGVANSTSNTPLPIPANVTSQLYSSIENQQLLNLGIIANITSSTMTPQTSLGQFQELLNGTAILNSTATSSGSNSQYQVFIGYKSPNATRSQVQSIFTYLVFYKWLLSALGSNRLQSHWQTRFQLPANSTLTNGPTIGQLGWTINFGGGTNLNATTSLNGSTVVLDEMMTISNQNVTATPDSLIQAFSNYKNFEIDYLAPAAGFSPTFSPAGVTDFTFDFTTSTTPRIPSITLSKTAVQVCSNNICEDEGFSVAVSATFSISTDAHLAFDPGKTFEAWFQTTASATFTENGVFQGHITAQQMKTLLLQLLRTFTFFVGPVFVYVNLYAEIDASVSLSLGGNMSIDGGITLGETFRDGVQWTSTSGWSPVASNNFTYTHQGPTIHTTQASATGKFSIPLQLELLVYDAAGPFIGIEPYVSESISIDTTQTTPVGKLTATLGVAFNGGVTVNPAIGTLLGIGSIQTSLGPDLILAQWSSTFSLSQSFTLTASASNPLFEINASIPVSGVVKSSAGPPVTNATLSLQINDASGTNVKLGGASGEDSTGGYNVVFSGISKTGTYTVEVDAKWEGVTMSEIFTIVIIPIDTTPPIITHTLNPTPNSKGWNNAPVTIVWSASDPESGVASTSGCAATTQSIETAGTSFTCKATNGVGLSSSSTITVKLDMTPPTITYSLSPAPNVFGWNNANVTVTFSCSDALSGVNTYSGPTTFTKEGAGQTVTGTCSDNAGNSASTTATVNIDKTPPATSISIGSPEFVSTATYVSVHTPFTLTATDNLSGVYQTTYGIDDSTTPNVYSTSFTINTVGTHTVYFRSTDRASNLEQLHSITVIVGATTLTYNGNTQAQYSDYGNLTATLIEVASQQPISGQPIAFTIGSQSISNTTVTTGVSLARLQLSQAAGSYTLLASFAGSSMFLPSSASSPFVIIKEDATITYTGDMVLGTTATSTNLRTTFIEDPDNHLGNLTRAYVTFRIYASNASQTLLQTLGPLQVTATGTPGVGVVTLSIPNLPENTYIIIVSLDPSANNYYVALDGVPVSLVVFQPNGSFVTGGGWINDTSTHGNFGFEVRYSSSGQVEGNFVYIYRINGTDHIIRSNGWIGLAVIGNHGMFQANATLTIIDPATGKTISTTPGYMFKVDIYANKGTTNNGGVDQFFITVWDKNGVVYHTAGGNLQGGSVNVHQ